MQAHVSVKKRLEWAIAQAQARNATYEKPARGGRLCDARRQRRSGRQSGRRCLSHAAPGSSTATVPVRSAPVGKLNTYMHSSSRCSRKKRGRKTALSGERAAESVCRGDGGRRLRPGAQRARCRGTKALRCVQRRAGERASSSQVHTSARRRNAKIWSLKNSKRKKRTPGAGRGGTAEAARPE